MKLLSRFERRRGIGSAKVGTCVGRVGGWERLCGKDM